jgi:hypothetical protein
MGRDQSRVLMCAVASLVLIAAGALVMDWYVLTLDGAVERVTIDLRSVHVCNVEHVCQGRGFSTLPGMFPTLAIVTLWSSLGFAALVAFQAGARLLTGSAYESFTSLGYMLALMAISLVVATAYLFGPEPQSVVQVMGSRLSLSLHRSSAPVVLIAGLAAGFAAVYLAIAAESSDLDATYKPVTIPPPLAGAGMASENRTRTGTLPPLTREGTGAMRMMRESTGAVRTGHGTQPPRSREPTGITRPERPATEPPRPRDSTGVHGARSEPRTREPTGLHSAHPAAPRTHEPTGVLYGLRPTEAPRTLTGVHRTRPSTDPSLSYTQPGIGPLSGTRAKSGPLPPMPEHLRNRLHYVALTAELTGGGIDARREDGLSRLVLWRDVVGVVVRRMPPVYDGAAFVDIVSTTGSTLRIVPWTRLTGELIEGEGDARPRAIVEHVMARCPGAKVDPATRQFLDSGEPAQLPDLDTLRAHDDRLA